MNPADPIHPPRFLAGCQLRRRPASRLASFGANAVVVAAAAAGRGGAQRAQRGEWRAHTAGFAVSTHAVRGWVLSVGWVPVGHLSKIFLGILN